MSILLRKTRFLACLLCLWTVFLSCRPSVDRSQVSGFSVTGVQWPQGIARVCFLDEGFRATKAAIQSIVEETFGKLTNMKFTGFEDCRALRETKSDIRIAFATGHFASGGGAVRLVSHRDSGNQF